jgi:hypothetical protein
MLSAFTGVGCWRSPEHGRMTTPLAINELRSARACGERYVGEWMPEAVITDGRE